MKTVPTYTATIYVGTREQYTPTIRSIDMARAWLGQYVSCGLCVTLTETEFIYTGTFSEAEGHKSQSEPGFIVGLINYPRFPADQDKIREHAIAIADGLRQVYKQFKITIVFPDETVMIDAESASTHSRERE